MNKTSITLRLADTLSKEVKEKAQSNSTTVTEYLTRLIRHGLQFENQEGIDYRDTTRQLEYSHKAVKDKLDYVEEKHGKEIEALRTENAFIKGEVKALKDVVLAGIQKK
jgi:hypothetical protein